MKERADDDHIALSGVDVPVTGWRRPALAPVYALTTAFVVVLGLGQLAPEPVLKVRMAEGGPGARIEVFDAAGATIQTGQLPPQGAYELPDMDGNRKVCVRLDAPWRVTEPVNGCTKGQVDADVQVAAVRDGRVHIVFDGVPAEPAKVSLRDTVSEETTEMSATGYYQPRRSLEGQTVCVEPPRGWVVQTQGVVKRDDARCTQAAVTEPADDIEFRLAEGSPR